MSEAEGMKLREMKAREISDKKMFELSPSIEYKISEKKLFESFPSIEYNWPMILYLSLVHFAAMYSLFLIGDASMSTMVFTMCMSWLSMLGITAGAHRLWSHRSYDASPPLRVFLMLCNSIANQGSIYHWSRDHRVHHKHSETDADPHNASNGFFFAHMGWLLIKKHQDVINEGNKLNFDDLLNDGAVMFQKRLDPWFALFMCFIMPALVCTLFGDNFWTGFFVAGMLRYVFSLHATWMVNSAAHLWGERPYDPISGPAENPFVAFLSIGEGWHNWHHKYPFDYAASEFGIDKQFNPTKLFLDFSITVGLASNPKRATGAWHKLRAKREAAKESTPSTYFTTDSSNKTK